MSVSAGATVRFCIPLRSQSLCEARHLVTFHHDPEHSDGDLEKLTNRALDNIRPACTVTIGAEGDTFQLNGN